MNVLQLEYILAIEEHQSFSRAAEAKCISQPALSMMMQKLEEEPDVKIFDRSKQPIIPTDAGKLILEKARLILRKIPNRSASAKRTARRSPSSAEVRRPTTSSGTVAKRTACSRACGWR